MSRKGENIYKRKDGRWEGRYIKARDLSGKIIYGYVYARTYRDVKIKLQRAANVKVSFPLECVTAQFSEIAEAWIENISPQIKESTENKYRNILRCYILPAFGHKKLEHISYNFIENYCDHLLITGGTTGCGLSSKTVTDILSVIRGILKFAKKRGYTVVCDGTMIHVKCTSREMRVLSISEQKRLCHYLYSTSTPYNMAILIALFTGLRIGEICALQWEDISFADHTLTVHHTLQRIQNLSNAKEKTRVVLTEPKSVCSIRTIPIPDKLFDLLKAYQTALAGYVLTNSVSHYIEPRTLQNQFKSILSKNAIDGTNFHTLRHTFATRCIELGFDVKSLSEILGHSTVNITMNRYVHPTLELKKENMQKLSLFLSVN